MLSLLILIPLLAAAALCRMEDAVAQRRARWAAGLELALSVVVSLRQVLGDGALWTEQSPWIPGLQLNYLVGVDGFTVLLLPATALLNLCVIHASGGWGIPRRAPFLALLLVLEGCTQGVFLALDLGLFFAFWELSVLPVYFLIAYWGIGPQRRAAATQYALTMVAGGALLLLAIALLALNHAAWNGIPAPAGLSFDYRVLLQTPMPAERQTLVFLLLLGGFAVKAPLVPLHTWLPGAAMEGPPGLVAVLVGLKLGLYGLLRFAVPLTPQGALELQGLLAALGALALLYGALVAWRQSNWRRLLAYSSASHVGAAVAGLASYTVQGVQGAALQLVNFSLVTGGLFLLAGALQRRVGSTDLSHLGGVAGSMPWLAGAGFVLMLASMGAPGTAGFAAELLLLLGAWQWSGWLGLCLIVGAVLGAVYAIGYYRAAFLGPVRNPAPRHLADLRPEEFRSLGAVVGLVLLAGFVPSLLLLPIEPAARSWVARTQRASADSGAGSVIEDESDRGTRRRQPAAMDFPDRHRSDERPGQFDGQSQSEGMVFERAPQQGVHDQIGPHQHRRIEGDTTDDHPIDGGFAHLERRLVEPDGREERDQPCDHGDSPYRAGTAASVGRPGGP